MRFTAALLAAALLTSGAFAQKSVNRPRITGVAFLSFYTADVAASQNFYSNVLGLRHVPDVRSTMNAVADYPVNRSQWIEVLPTVPDDTHRLHAVGFTTKNAARLQQYLAAKGYAAESPLHDGMFSVRDPEGNLVYFVQSGSRRAVAKSAPSPTATARRIIHAGFVVQDADKENRFWRETLGFRPYWHGGHDDASNDYVSQQVPDGTDWLEYMLNVKPDAGRKQLGVMDHVSLGVEKMDSVVAQLQKNGCTGADCTAAKLGRDGKVQLNMYDPDQSRIEFMEFKPSGPTCCSTYTGPHPSASR